MNYLYLLLLNIVHAGFLEEINSVLKGANVTESQVHNRTASGYVVFVVSGQAYEDRENNNWYQLGEQGVIQDVVEAYYGTRAVLYVDDIDTHDSQAPNVTLTLAPIDESDSLTKRANADRYWRILTRVATCGSLGPLAEYYKGVCDNFGDFFKSATIGNPDASSMHVSIYTASYCQNRIQHYWLEQFQQSYYCSANYASMFFFWYSS